LLFLLLSSIFNSYFVRRAIMLKFMRTHATSWFIKILLGAIIVVFVLWGMGSIRTKKETVIATVGGDYITRMQFERTYHAVMEYYTRAFGRQLSPDLLKGLNIKQQVLDQLIDAAVVHQEGQRIGLQVSAEELRESIRQDPNFQRGGRFSRALYEQMLGSMGLDNEGFQTMTKRDLLNQRMAHLIGDIAVILTEEEVKRLYFLENEQISLDFVNVSPSAIVRRVTITQSDLEHYYSEHEEEFRTSPRGKVLYVRFSPQAYRTEVTVSPEEVQEYYDMHLDQYQQPERVRVRHILIGVGPEAGPDAVKAAKKKAEKVLAEARRGVNFADLARKYSDDRSASEGGDLGYFVRGEMEPTLERIVFSLRRGEIGPVVRTRYGFHIVKVEDREPGKTRALDEVKDEIIAHLSQEKANNLAAMHAEDAAYRAKKKGETGDLKAYADEKGLQVLEVGPFKAGEPLEGLGSRERFTSVAFTLGAGEVSSAFQDGDDYFVPSDPPPGRNKRAGAGGPGLLIGPRDGPGHRPGSSQQMEKG
jgi:peptidyl-prolyl cis-trans isomerase D